MNYKIIHMRVKSYYILYYITWIWKNYLTRKLFIYSNIYHNQSQIDVIMYGDNINLFI